MSFESFNLHPRVLAGVRQAGFKTPTPIQSQAIPEALEGRDVMGLAQTGTGKTAAFVLPMLQRLMDGPRGKARALVITPTRELAEQTRFSIAALGRGVRLRCMTIYGGVAMGPQIRGLKAGVDIIVACPGRLLDHIGQGTADLCRVEMLVLDEADRMLDMGFMPDVRKILGHVPAKRQTLLFSATMPEDIRGLAARVMRDPVTVQIGHSQPANTVSHELYPVEGHQKTQLLISLLRGTQTDSVLVFTRTRKRTERVSEQLRRAGFEAAALEGGMSQSRRQAVLDGFREGRYRILVATDVAARGVDILSISHVINYDMPDSPDAYTHRVGRTGRAARTGSALTLVTKEDAPTVRAFERVMNVELVCRELEGFDYGTPQTAPRPHSCPAPPPYRRTGRRPRRPIGRSNARAGRGL